MKIYPTLTLLLAAVFGVVAIATPAHSKTKASESAAFRYLSEQNADRLLLVGFTDNSINSIKGTASPASYRPRGTYNTTTWSERVTDDLADDYGLEKLTEWPMTEVGVHCVVYRVPDKDSVSGAIEKLSKDERVEVVQNMHVFKTKGQIYNDPYFKLQTNLQQMQINLAHGRSTGKNITVGVIDTGIDMSHPDLAGQISDNKNFAKEISPSFDTDKHGTAVAGVIAARSDNSKGIIGVAPNAKLVALKACWPNSKDAVEAVCNSYTLAFALNTAIKMGVNVLNMSLTGPEDPIMALLIKKAIDKGIIVVAADTGSKNKAENFPASMENVISVQSIKKPDSQVLTLPNAVAAPGEQVLTTLPYGTYDFISGSSIAAAEVSGVVALLLELKPDLTVAEANNVLQKAKVISKDGVNANIAVNTLCESIACSKDNVVSYAQVD